MNGEELDPENVQHDPAESKYRSLCFCVISLAMLLEKHLDTQFKPYFSSHMPNSYDSNSCNV
jgi:hypothetical protein